MQLKQRPKEEFQQRIVKQITTNRIMLCYWVPELDLLVICRPINPLIIKQMGKIIIQETNPSTSTVGFGGLLAPLGLVYVPTWTFGSFFVGMSSFFVLKIVVGWEGELERSLMGVSRPKLTRAAGIGQRIWVERWAVAHFELLEFPCSKWVFSI